MLMNKVCWKLDRKHRTFPLKTEEWTDAFLLFVSIYISTHPEEIHPLIKYMTIIHDASKKIPSFLEDI